MGVCWSTKAPLSRRIAHPRREHQRRETALFHAADPAFLCEDLRYTGEVVDAQGRGERRVGGWRFWNAAASCVG
jgi:hypothetical protein